MNLKRNTMNAIMQAVTILQIRTINNLAWLYMLHGRKSLNSNFLCDDYNGIKWRKKKEKKRRKICNEIKRRTYFISKAKL